MEEDTSGSKEFTWSAATWSYSPSRPSTSESDSRDSSPAPPPYYGEPDLHSPSAQWPIFDDDSTSESNYSDLAFDFKSLKKSEDESSPWKLFKKVNGSGSENADLGHQSTTDGPDVDSRSVHTAGPSGIRSHPRTNEQDPAVPSTSRTGQPKQPEQDAPNGNSTNRGQVTKPSLTGTYQDMYKSFRGYMDNQPSSDSESTCSQPAAPGSDLVRPQGRPTLTGRYLDMYRSSVSYMDNNSSSDVSETSREASPSRSHSDEDIPEDRPPSHSDSDDDSRQQNSPERVRSEITVASSDSWESLESGMPSPPTSDVDSGYGSTNEPQWIYQPRPVPDEAIGIVLMPYAADPGNEMFVAYALQTDENGQQQRRFGPFQPLRAQQRVVNGDRIPGGPAAPNNDIQAEQEQARAVPVAQNNVVHVEQARAMPAARNNAVQAEQARAVPAARNNAVQAEQARAVPAARNNAVQAEQARAVLAARNNAVQAEQARAVPAARNNAVQAEQARAVPAARNNAVETQQARDVPPARNNSVHAEQARAVPSARDNVVHAEQARAVPPVRDNVVHAEQARAVPSARDNVVHAEQARAVPAARNNVVHDEQARAVPPARNNAVKAQQARAVPPARNNIVQAAQAHAVPPARNNIVQAAQARAVPPARNNIVQAAQAHAVPPARNNIVQAAQARAVPPARNNIVQAAQAHAVPPARNNIVHAEQARAVPAAQPGLSNINYSKGSPKGGSLPGSSSSGPEMDRNNACLVYHVSSSGSLSDASGASDVMIIDLTDTSRPESVRNSSSTSSDTQSDVSDLLTSVSGSSAAAGNLTSSSSRESVFFSSELELSGDSGNCSNTSVGVSQKVISAKVSTDETAKKCRQTSEPYTSTSLLTRTISDRDADDEEEPRYRSRRRRICRMNKTLRRERSKRRSDREWIKWINSTIVEPCNKITLSSLKRKRSPSPARTDTKKPRTSTSGIVQTESRKRKCTDDGDGVPERKINKTHCDETPAVSFRRTETESGSGPATGLYRSDSGAMPALVAQGSQSGGISHGVTPNDNLSVSHSQPRSEDEDTASPPIKTNWVVRQLFT